MWIDLTGDLIKLAYMCFDGLQVQTELTSGAGAGARPRCGAVFRVETFHCLVLITAKDINTSHCDILCWGA